MTGVRVELFKARNGKWGFRTIAANGRKVLTSGQTFRGSSTHARRAIARALRLTADAFAHGRVVVR
jgi:uncharacterized protein YegP (UPF0339 family)